MTLDEFKTFALHELANEDMRALVAALQGENGLMRDGINEVLRLAKAWEVFPSMSMIEMWATDHSLESTGKRGRPTKPDLHRFMSDPAWAATQDLKKLKQIWREVFPSKRPPVEFLTDIAVAYRGADRATVEARRSRPKKRLLSGE